MVKDFFACHHFLTLRYLLTLPGNEWLRNLLKNDLLSIS
jgi:hypothetical protein